MAWDPLPDGGFIGDLPADALADALDEIARGYEHRFGRPPMLHEVVRAFETVLGARRHDVVYDPERIGELRIHMPPPAALPVEPDDYVAAWSAEPPPDGTHWVRHAASGADVLRCLLALEDRMLWARYEILREGLTHADARLLILDAILHAYTGHAFAEQADVVAFVSLAGEPHRTVLPYPG